MRRSMWLLLLATLQSVSCGGGGQVPGGDDLLMREDLQRVLETTYERDVAGLSTYLENPDGAVRRRAALGMASTRDLRVVPLLTERLRDPDAGVREAAAFALGTLGGADQALVEALAGEGNAVVRLRLLDALGRSGGSVAAQALTSGGLRTGEEAAHALALGRLLVSGVNSPEAFTLLVGGLRGADPQLRRNAAWAFGRLASAAPWRSWAPEIRRALDEFDAGDLAAGPLLTGLSRLGDPADTPRMLFWLRDSTEWQVRYLAAVALTARVDDPRVREALFAAIDDDSPHVGGAAATAVSTLAQIEPAEWTAMDTWLVSHPEDRTRAFPLLVAFSSRERPEVVQRWLARIPTPSVEDRAVAAAALALEPGPRGFEAVLDGLREGGVIAVRTYESLGQRWSADRADPIRMGRLYPALLQSLAEGGRSEVVAAATLLSDAVFQERGATVALIERAQRLDPSTEATELSAVTEAISALGGSLAGLPEPIRPPRRGVDWEAARRWGSRPTLVLETDAGRVVVRLDLEAAPLTVASILGLAQGGAFDGVPFHRVVPGFVVQGGDVGGGDGLGGPGYQIRTEPTLRTFERGVLGMASAGPDTEGSQFFVMQAAAPHLDGGYTAFGEVVEGMDVVDRIQQGDHIRRAMIAPPL